MAANKTSKRIRLKIPPVLFAKTQRVVKAVQKAAGMTFMSYWTSPNGSVCSNDVVGFYEILQKLGKQEQMALFIKSDGGSGQASLRIVNLLRQYADRLVVIVPLECASAATMLALGADEIRMGPLAYLTPVDTSIRHNLSPVDNNNDRVSVSQDELTRAINLWNKAKVTGPRSVEGNPYASLYEHVHPLVIGAVDRSSSLSVRLCTDILRFHMKDKRKAEAISHRLNATYPTHSYPIILNEARQLGLKVRELAPSINSALLELNELYSEMGQRALTDYDERNYHNNEILNILEGVNLQIYYQQDKDWHYRAEERSWVPMNDDSSWRKIEKVKGKTIRSVFHVR